eukprot:gene24063-26997_t
MLRAGAATRLPRAARALVRPLFVSCGALRRPLARAPPIGPR